MKEYDSIGCRKLLCAMVECAIEDYRGMNGIGIQCNIKESSRNIRLSNIESSKTSIESFFKSEHIDEILEACGLNISGREVSKKLGIQ